MPFEVFMDVALYDEDGGFFGSGKLRSEKGGDFLTSPEVSPLFGETLATYVASEYKRIGDPFQLVEVAAGSGSLLRPLVAEFEVESLAVEVAPAAQSALSDQFEVSDRIPDSIRGIVIANELLDNLPMALAQRVDGKWRERWVGLDGAGLAFVDAEPRAEVSEWLNQFAVEVADGGWVEVQLEAALWLSGVIGVLDAGSVVVIDYGDTSENLLPRRHDGTLRTYRAHHLGPHPLDEPGETDITADVEFSALMSVASAAGASVTLQRQDDFLASLGLRDQLSVLRKSELEAARAGDEMERLRWRSLKTEAETLLHPRGLGDFRVLIASV